MKTLTRITINPEPATLARYTHARTRHSAERLATHIADLEAAGFVVLSARSAKSTVPNSYGPSAYKMHAPYYWFNSETRTIDLVDGKLETRPKGAAIPARFMVAGDKVPAGFRCVARHGESVELVPA